GGPAADPGSRLDRDHAAVREAHGRGGDAGGGEDCSQGGDVNAKDACREWAGILRAVAEGRLSPAEGRARRPEVDDPNSVPSAYWNVSWMLELETEDRQQLGIDVPDLRSEFASRLRKLADRVEGIEQIP